MILSDQLRCHKVQLTPLSRAIGAAGILTVAGGGAMGSTPGVLAGTLILLFLFSRATVFFSGEKMVLRSIRIDRQCDNLIIRQYGLITVSLSATAEIPEGVDALLRDHPGPGFSIVDDLPLLDLREGDLIRYRIRAITRGSVSFHGAVVTLADSYFTSEIAFGREEDRNPMIRVQPQGSPVLAIGDSLGYGDATSRRYISPSGSVVRSYREYMPGDDTRQIDWKTTAKRDQLIIRETYAQRGEIPMIVLDLSESASENEKLVGFTVGTIEETLKVSHSVSLLVVAGGTVLRFLPNERQSYRVLAAIRDLPPAYRDHHFYRYAAPSDLAILMKATSANSSLNRWYGAVQQIRGIPAFEKECLRALSRARGTSLLLFSSCTGDVSHLAMVTRAARRVGLSVHLRIPSSLPQGPVLSSLSPDSALVI